MKLVNNIEIKTDIKMIKKYMGYPKSGHVSKEIQKLLDKGLMISQKLIKPKGVFHIFEIEELEEKDIFEGAEKVALCICTIGNELETEVSRLLNENENTLALILDSIGSDAAEQTAQQINETIDKIAYEQKYHTSRRFSPGYGKWDVKGQKLFFDLLETKKSGVTLNPSYMMIPRKSVSFAIKFGKNIHDKKKRSACELCKLTDCRFRTRIND